MIFHVTKSDRYGIIFSFPCLFLSVVFHCGSSCWYLIIFVRSYVHYVALSKRSVYLFIFFYFSYSYDLMKYLRIWLASDRYLFFLYCHDQVQQVCINCGVCMGKYFCETCKLFDDDVSTRSNFSAWCFLLLYWLFLSFNAETAIICLVLDETSTIIFIFFL